MNQSNTDVETILEVFSVTTWADGLSLEERKKFAGYLKFQVYPQGETILKEGTREAFMCIIIVGRVNILKDDDYNKKKTLSSLGKGKSFGEMSLLDGEPRSATVVASEITTVLRLTKESLLQLIKDDPALGAKLLLKLGKTLSQRLRLMDGKILAML